MKNAIFALTNVLKDGNYTLISLSETQLFQCDDYVIKKVLSNNYKFYLNSDDRHDPNLPMTNRKSFGGTMLLWNSWVDPYLQIIPPVSHSFLIAILTLPDHVVTVLE